MKKDLTEVVFILDRSGSMSGLESDTIGGFNAMLEKQKKESGEALFSTVLFSDGSEVLHDRVPVAEVKPLTDREYSVGGCTALLDAVGAAIRHIGHLHKALPEEERPEKTLFVITTDGMENSSRRYTYDKVRKMVEKKKEKNHWEFIFLGANIDAVQVASRFGVSASRAVRYENDSYGAALNYDVISSMVSGARKARSAAMMGACYDTGADLKAVHDDYEELEELAKETTPEADADAATLAIIRNALSTLSGRDREVMKHLHGLDGERKLGYEETAAVLGTAPARIRQVERRVLRGLGLAS
ncbi:MAG: VWA domain-containing protein [Lachnospiraceae bacterium]|nr:VWA domain-containing protein [Lachnospiraceae bacterium]